MGSSLDHMGSHSDHIHITAKQMDAVSQAMKAAALDVNSVREALTGLSFSAQIDTVSIDFNTVFEEEVQVLGWLDAYYLPQWLLVNRESFLNRLAHRAGVWYRSGVGYCLGLNETQLSQERTLWNLRVRIALGNADSSLNGKYPSAGYRLQYGETVGTEYLHSMGNGDYVHTKVISFEKGTAVAI